MENAAVAGWKLCMRNTANHFKQCEDLPNYWTSPQGSLETSANVRLVRLGSGAEVYEEILPSIEQVEEELILVTCFWARSETQQMLNASLRTISRRAEQRGRKIRVRICCSSISAWQKITHTRSLQGQVYPPARWTKIFGLPSAHELRGLDLEIKSIFVLPFSVMHPKFIILDRKLVFLPSCNVSWENCKSAATSSLVLTTTGFEGCVQLTGPIVQHFVKFWQSFWASSHDRELPVTAPSSQQLRPALFLPSPHHPLALFDVGMPASPPTPLNLFLLSVLAQASHSIYLQTPNLTSRAVLNAIIAALQRGIDITIVTSERLMILEQIVTARTTTARCVKWLAKQHTKLLHHHDIEAQRHIGSLSIAFYEPRPHTSDPVQSHIKLTISDDELIILGSGNLDRASWVTSQEQGVAIHDKTFVHDFRHQLDTMLQGRLRTVYP